MNTGGENSTIQREGDESPAPKGGSDAPTVEPNANKRASNDEPTRGAKVRRALIEVSVALLVIVGIRTLQSRSHASGQAPIVRGVALDGRAVALGSGGGPRVLWFFATWCSVCRASDHNIRRFAGDPSVVLVASESGDDARVRAFVRAQGLEQNIVVNDPDGSIARRYGVRSFPTTFTVDRQGLIRGTDVGYTTELGLRARRWWATVR